MSRTRARTQRAQVVMHAHTCAPSLSPDTVLQPAPPLTIELARTRPAGSRPSPAAPERRQSRCAGARTAPHTAPRCCSLSRARARGMRAGSMCSPLRTTEAVRLPGGHVAAVHARGQVAAPVLAERRGAVPRREKVVQPVAGSLRPRGSAHAHTSHPARPRRAANKCTQAPHPLAHRSQVERAGRKRADLGMLQLLVPAGGRRHAARGAVSGPRAAVLACPSEDEDPSNVGHRPGTAVPDRRVRRGPGAFPPATTRRPILGFPEFLAPLMAAGASGEGAERTWRGETGLRCGK